MTITKEKELVILNPIVTYSESDLIEVMRISEEDDLTRIDFLYEAPRKYKNGGWVSMQKTCFIRPVGTKSKLTLVKACNIALAPNKHFFKKCGELLAYTLYFPKLPEGVKQIDIIEHEGEGGEWFNFYGVELKRVHRSLIFVEN